MNASKTPIQIITEHIRCYRQNASFISISILNLHQHALSQACFWVGFQVLYTLIDVRLQVPFFVTWKKGAFDKSALFQETKMTGGTPEVRSDKSLTLLTFDIWFLTFDIWHMTFYMDQWTNWPMDQWTREWREFPFPGIPVRISLIFSRSTLRNQFLFLVLISNHEIDK